MQTLLSQADVFTSTHIASILFSKPGAHLRLALQISSAQVDWQLSSMTQICNHFSPFLSRVTDLGISSTQQPIGTDDIDREQWAEIICAFNNAGVFRAAGTLAADILGTLSLTVRDPNVPPVLHTLHISKLGPEHRVALRKAAESFVTSRRLSGHPVQVHPPLVLSNLNLKTYRCGVCDMGFSQRQGLNRHIRDIHGPANVCQHCHTFTWSSGRQYLYRTHLRKEHPEVVYPQ